MSTKKIDRCKIIASPTARYSQQLFRLIPISQISDETLHICHSVIVKGYLWPGYDLLH